MNPFLHNNDDDHDDHDDHDDQDDGDDDDGDNDDDDDGRLIRWRGEDSPFPASSHIFTSCEPSKRFSADFLLPEMQMQMMVMMMRRWWIFEIEELRRGDFY